MPDLRRACGDGMGARVSKDDKSGLYARTDGLKGREVPVGLSGTLPFCCSRKEDGGAKSMVFNNAESVLSM